VDDLLVMRRLGALGRHGNELAVAALHLLFAVDGQRAQPERLRVDHMAQAARVDQGLGLGQGLHQQADAAGMVQVDMGGNDPVHGVARQAQRVQRRQQARHGMVGAGVDEGGAAVLHHQIGGVEARALKAGVDGVDAVAEVFDEVKHGLPRISCSR